MSNYNNQNRNARISTRIDLRGKTRTETRSRDSGSIVMAATTDTKNDSTNVFIDFPDGDQVKLDGREARTMYRLLSKHYASTGKSQF